MEKNEELLIVTPVDSESTCWAIRLHPNSGSFYYENMNTGVIVWEDPTSLLEGISEAVQADVLEEEEQMVHGPSLQIIKREKSFQQ